MIANFLRMLTRTDPSESSGDVSGGVEESKQGGGDGTAVAPTDTISGFDDDDIMMGPLEEEVNETKVTDGAWLAVTECLPGIDWCNAC